MKQEKHIIHFEYCVSIRLLQCFTRNFTYYHVMHRFAVFAGSNVVLLVFILYLGSSLL